MRQNKGGKDRRGKGGVDRRKDKVRRKKENKMKGETVAGSDTEVWRRGERRGGGAQPGALRGYWVVDSQSLSA